MFICYRTCGAYNIHSKGTITLGTKYMVQPFKSNISVRKGLGYNVWFSFQGIMTWAISMTYIEDQFMMPSDRSLFFLLDDCTKAPIFVRNGLPSSSLVESAGARSEGRGGTILGVPCNLGFAVWHLIIRRCNKCGQ